MVKQIDNDKSEEERDAEVVRKAIKRVIIYGVLIVLAIVILVALFGSAYTINAGQRGVLLTFGKLNPVAQGEGLHFKLPLVQSVIKMDVQTQKYVVEKASSASKDLQIVTTDVTLNYYISPDSAPELYRSIGLAYQDKVITPAVLEVVKAITAQYTAEELITKRPEVKEKIDVALKERLSSFNILVQTISITNFDFSKSFNDAIEAKVTAEQNALAAKNKLAQVEYEAQQRVTQAEGEAKAIQVQIEAIRQNGGDNYVRLKSIEKWNGQLPTFMSGSNGAVPFIDVNSMVTKTA